MPTPRLTRAAERLVRRLVKMGFASRVCEVANPILTRIVKRAPGRYIR